MLLLVELLMLICGIWAIATGKLPRLLFGGSQYTAEGRKVRLLGVLLVLPIPLAILGTVLLDLLFGMQCSGCDALLELFIVGAVGFASLIVFRAIRQPVAKSNALAESARIETLISKKSYGALMYALLGGLGFTVFLLCPLALIRANHALRLINQHRVGEQYRHTANLARVLAALILLAYSSVGVCVVTLMIMYGQRG